MIFLIFAVLLYLFSVALLGYMAFSFFYFKGWNNPPYIPSFGKTKKAVIGVVAEILKQSDTPLHVADLGCGDGALLSGLAPKFPRHIFYGYEWDTLPFTIAKKRLKKYRNTHIIQADLMKTDLKHLDIVLCYLAHIPGLGERLKQTLKPTATVISEVFEIDGWTPQKTLDSRLLGFKSKIFIYQVQEQKLPHH